MSATSTSTSSAPRRGRNWCFTYNNPPSTELAVPDSATYVVYQLEQGESGTPHLQGYIRFKSEKSLHWLKEKFPPTIHWERARGTAAQNKAYCTKEEGRLEGPFEFGELSQQGRRTDLQAAAALAVSTGSFNTVLDEMPGMAIRYTKGLQAAIAHTQTRKRKSRGFVKPTIKVYYGESGLGKTKLCYDEYPDLYCNTTHAEGGNTLWYDGYEGEDTILYDDFQGGIHFRQLLHLLDGYPVRVQYKGGSTTLLATTVLITSNLEPTDWYKKAEANGLDCRPLYRRLKEFGEVNHVSRAPDGELVLSPQDYSHYAEHGCPHEDVLVRRPGEQPRDSRY